MKILLTLFRIVINWTCKILVKILKKVLRELENDLCEKIANKVVQKLSKKECIKKRKNRLRRF